MLPDPMAFFFTGVCTPTGFPSGRTGRKQIHVSIVDYLHALNSIETVESEALLNCEDPKRSSPDSPCTKRPKMRVKAQMN